MKIKLLVSLAVFSCLIYGQNGIGSTAEGPDVEIPNTAKHLSDDTNQVTQITTYGGSFGNAFLQARLELGPSQDFIWEGKIFTTDFTHDHQIPIIYRSIEGLQTELKEKTIALDSVIYAKSKELDIAILSASVKIELLDSLIVELSTKSERQYQAFDKTINSRTLYWLLATAFLIIIIASIFYILKSKMSDQDDSLLLVKKTQEKLENETLQLDTRLIQILEQKLDLAAIQPQKTKDVDHTLPIKLGEEIHRMRKRLNMMEESQGTKVLAARIESLESKLNESGYEIIDLLGRKYDEGMELGNTQFIPDDSLKDGERIITRVIKPQISFKGEIIHAADVDISQSD